MDLVERPRRNRRSDALRRMVREHHLRPDDFIWPMFVIDGKDREPIASMPGIDRLPLDHAVKAARHAYELGIPAVALFPALDDTKKDRLAKESTNKDGLLQRTVRALKDAVPELLETRDRAEQVLPAGARFHYSNLAFALLGVVVERVGGLPYRE